MKKYDFFSEGPTSTNENDWPEPSPLGPELPPVNPFRCSMLPEVFRDTVEDLSERMQVPPDLPAAAAILCLAGAVNRRARIQPKRQDSTWIVVPNLWGGLVAPPGFLKSPVLASITWPLREIEALWRAEYTAEMEQYEGEKETAELRLAVWKEQSKRALKNPKAVPPLRPDVSLVEPVMRRLIVGDATFEKLHELMAENPAGLLVVRDELTGWWAQLDRVGREGERAFCLQAWNGDTGHTIDRIGRGSVYVPACCLSLLGGITPGRLRSYLVDALEDGPTNDGLIQRFQVLVWPDAPPEWKYVDRLPKTDRMSGVFRRLTGLDVDAPALYMFDDAAQEFFQGWLGCLEARIRRDDLHPALISHLGKMRKTMPALSGLLSLADGQESPMDLPHAQMAADWCEYLESHARRVYACVVSARMKAAADLAAKLKKGKVGGGGTVTRRDIYRNQWTGLDTPESAGDALEILEDAGWVRPCPSQSPPIGGRPADRWQINPKIVVEAKSSGNAPDMD
jgi:putative DNA primase/helicase